MEVSSQLTEALFALGPWVVFFMTFAETAFIIGLVLPAEPTIIAACVLALEGHFGLGGVVAATLSGGALGDTCGFWLGRRGGRRLLRGSGRIREIARNQEIRTSRLVQRHSVFAVSIGRMIAFVRTIMPIMAGMSELTYRRFLVYDLLGVALWGAGSILIGVGVAAGWQRARDDLGPWWAAAVVLLAIGLFGLVKVRRVRRAREKRRVESASGDLTARGRSRWL